MMFLDYLMITVQWGGLLYIILDIASIMVTKQHLSGRIIRRLKPIYQKIKMITFTKLKRC